MSLEAAQELLLSGEQLHYELVPGPRILQSTESRNGKNQQRRRERQFVLALAREKAPSLQQVWIGLKYNARGKGFYWSDHSALTVYKNWAPKEPNGYGREPCINMWTGQSNMLPHRASGYWNGLPCAALKTLPCGVVCKKLA